MVKGMVKGMYYMGGLKLFFIVPNSCIKTCAATKLFIYCLNPWVSLQIFFLSSADFFFQNQLFSKTFIGMTQFGSESGPTFSRD